MLQSSSMDMAEYIELKPLEEVESLADRAKTKVVYLKQIASKHRRPSGSLALKLERESNYELTRHELRPDLYPEQSA